MLRGKSVRNGVHGDDRCAGVNDRVNVRDNDRVRVGVRVRVSCSCRRSRH